MRTQTDPYKIHIPDALEDVREFTTEICNRTGRWMPGRPGSFADVRLSRAKLIFEEYAETRDAIDAGDAEGELDGMVDLLYVVLGAQIERPLNTPWPILQFERCGIEKVCGYAINHLSDGMWIDESVSAWRILAESSGLPIGAAWNEVHAANMRKFQGGHYDASAGKWKKPADWVGPDIAGVLAKYPSIKR